MNNPNHISESLDTIFWVKILKFFDGDPDPGRKKIRIRDKHPGSATLQNYKGRKSSTCGKEEVDLERYGEDQPLK